MYIYLLNSCFPLPLPPLPDPAPSKPVEAVKAAPAPPKVEGGGGGGGGLSAKEIEALEDSPVLAPYLRMKSVGVPLPGIKKKMKDDGVEQR